MDLSAINKAIAGGITAAIVAVLARYGFQPHTDTITALGVIITALVGYVVGHIVVYLSPANKPKQ